MYDQPTGNWELAISPFGAPEEDLQSASTNFDTLNGTHEAQSYLRTVNHNSHLPAASKLVGDPVWPNPPLLHQSRAHLRDYISSNLCQNIGVRTHRVTLPQGSDPEGFSFDMRLDKLLSLEWDYALTDGQNVEGTSTSESFHMEPEVFFGEYFDILEAKAADDVCTIRFSKRPIKKVNAVSLMPTVNEFRLMAETEYKSRNFSPVKIGQEKNHSNMCSAFSDASASSGSYYSSKSSFIVNLPYYLEPEFPFSGSHNPLTASDARSVDEMANAETTQSLSSYSQLNLLSLTPVIHAPLRSVGSESKLPAGSHNAERIHSTMGNGTGALNVDANATSELRIFGAANNRGGGFMTDDAGRTPYTCYPIGTRTACVLESKVSTRRTRQSYRNVHRGENLGKQTRHSSMKDLYLTTSSTDEAESAVIAHHSGEELLDPDVESVLRFATRALSALDTDFEDENHDALTRADESRLSFNGVTTRGTTATTGKFNAVVDAHLESMSADELDLRRSSNRDSFDPEDLIFSVDDDEALPPPVQADQHGTITYGLGHVQHTVAPKPSPFRAIARLPPRALPASMARRHGRVQRTAAPKPSSPRAVTRPPPRSSPAKTARRPGIRTGGSSAMLESTGLVFDELWRSVGMSPEPVWWVRLCDNVLYCTVAAAQPVQFIVLCLVHRAAEVFIPHLICEMIAFFFVFLLFAFCLFIYFIVLLIMHMLGA